MFFTSTCISREKKKIKLTPVEKEVNVKLFNVIVCKETAAFLLERIFAIILCVILAHSAVTYRTLRPANIPSGAKNVERQFAFPSIFPDFEF